MSDLYQLATRLRSFDPSTVKTYRIDGQGVTIGGALGHPAGHDVEPGPGDPGLLPGQLVVDLGRVGERRVVVDEQLDVDVDLDDDVDLGVASSGRRRRSRDQHDDHDARRQRPATRPGERRDPAGRPDLPLTGCRSASESPANRQLTGSVPEELRRRPRGSADGPLSRPTAPPPPGQALGVVQSPAGATTTSSSSRRAAPTTSPGTVARPSDSRTVTLPGRPRPRQLLAGRRQRQGQVGRPEAPQRQQVLHHLLGRPEHLLALGRHHVAAEGQHAVVLRRPPRHRRGRHRRRRQPLAAHRAAAVDHAGTAPSRARPSPAPHVLAGRAPARAAPASAKRTRSRRRDRGRRRVSSSGSRLQLARPPGATGPPPPGEVDHEPAGQPPGQLPQLRVGGAR